MNTNKMIFENFNEYLERIEQVNEFKHEKKYAYGEVRSFKEFSDSEITPDYFLVDINNKKIVAGYTNGNVPNYSKYFEKNKENDYELWSISTMKHPEPYLKQFPLDYTNKQNWIN